MLSPYSGPHSIGGPVVEKRGVSAEPYLPQPAQSTKAMQQRAHNCIDHELHHAMYALYTIY